ncbi:MAG: ketopantoate reductase family protein, partial [bacterium]
MKEDNLRIAVIGAGAIGGITAALLSRKGHDVEIVCKYQETVDLVQSKGLHVSGILGEFYAKTAAVKEISDIKEKMDVVFIATKVNDTSAVARQIAPFLKENALVVSLQNGIIEDELAGVVGQDRVVGCVVGWSATMIGPADMVFTRAGDFIVGDLFGLGDKKVAVVADILNDVVETRIVQNILGELFSKLILNCCINALSVITGLNIGPMLDLKPVRDLFIVIMAEAVAVADASGVELVPIMGGQLDYHAFLRGDDVVSCQKRDDLL